MANKDRDELIELDPSFAAALSQTKQETDS